MSVPQTSSGAWMANALVTKYVDIKRIYSFIETSRLRKSIIFSILLIIGEGDPVDPFPKTMDRIELIECDPLYEFQCHRPSRVMNISTLLCIGIIIIFPTGYTRMIFTSFSSVSLWKDSAMELVTVMMEVMKNQLIRW